MTLVRRASARAGGALPPLWALRSAIAACAIIGVASAQAVTGPAQFQITWPEGWTQAQQDGFVTAEPPGGVPFTQCAAAARNEEGTSAMTQADINSQLAQPLSDDDWRLFAGGDLVQPFFDKIVIPGPTVGQHATTTTVTADLAIIKLRAAIFVVPGTVFVATCAAPSAAYDSLAASFETRKPKRHRAPESSPRCR